MATSIGNNSSKLCALQQLYHGNYEILLSSLIFVLEAASKLGKCVYMLVLPAKSMEKAGQVASHSWGFKLHASVEMQMWTMGRKDHHVERIWVELRL